MMACRAVILVNAPGDEARRSTIALLVSIALHTGVLFALSIVAVVAPTLNLREPFPLFLGPLGPAGGIGAASGLGAPAAAGGTGVTVAATPALEPEPGAPEPVHLAPKPKAIPKSSSPKPKHAPSEIARTAKPKPEALAVPATSGSKGDNSGGPPGEAASNGVPGGRGAGRGGLGELGAGGTASYEQLLAAWLDSHKYYPSTLRRRGIQGEGKLQIEITRTGRIVDVEVVKPFSHPSLESIAQDWVKRSEPFPAMPDSIEGEHYTFVVPVVFRLE